MDTADAIEQARNRKNILYQRIREAKKSASATVNPSERRRQLERARILTDMYRDACDELARLEGRSRDKKHREVHGDAIFNSKEVWADLNGVRWGELDGGIWDDILSVREPGAATGRQYKLLVDLLNDSVNGCTQRQKQFIHEYYTLQKSMPVIGEQYGVDKSTVSRVLKAGLGRVGRHVMARLTIAACIDDKGRFDYLKFCRSAKLLTERQTEILYLALTQDSSYTMMAAYIDRDLSTVSRTVDRLENRLRAVRVELLPEIDVSGVKFRDWSGISELELAKRLGLNRRFFYTMLHRGETVEGLPMLHYHALCRMRSGWTDSMIGEELGITRRWCKSVRRRYEGFRGVLELSRLPAYTPDRVMRNVRQGTVLASLRDLTRGGDGIIDRIDGSMLAKIKEAGLC